jgi:hypothetical protein
MFIFFSPTTHTLINIEDEHRLTEVSPPTGLVPIQ